jgi:DNA-binding MurR/RpiR family transcriptional regulator
LGEYIAEISKDDLVIVIAVRRRVAILPEAMQAINAKGAPILYLTDPTASKTTANAKWVIKSAVANSYLFDSFTSLMSIARFLAMESYRVSGVKGRDHLKMIETEHENLSEFE